MPQEFCVAIHARCFEECCGAFSAELRIFFSPSRRLTKMAVALRKSADF